jgi:hypothetical protein
MTADPEPRTAAIKVGYEQFVPPPVPPGMWYDGDRRLVLPDGLRPASKGPVAASYLLAVGLFIVTLGVGYLGWAVVTRARPRRSGSSACDAGGRIPAARPAASTWRCARASDCC